MNVKEVMHKGVDWVSPDTPVVDTSHVSPGDLLARCVKSVLGRH